MKQCLNTLCLPGTAGVMALPACILRKEAGADPLNLGFDVNVSGHAAGGPGSYQGEEYFGNAVKGRITIPWCIPGLERYHGDTISLSEALTREAVTALDIARATGKLFYLYMAHYEVHIQPEPDRRFYQKYIDMGYEEPEARDASMVEAMDKSLGDLMNNSKMICSR